MSLHLQHQENGKLVVSDHYPNPGANPVFDLIAADGTNSPLPGNNAYGLLDEVKLATVRAGSSCTTAKDSVFVPGEIYFGNGSAGGIGKISAGGITTTAWVTLPDSALVRGSLYVDRGCNFDGDLIVATGDDQGVNPLLGRIWLVHGNADGTGTATLVADIGRHLEGVITVPDDSFTYGPLAGRILAGDESLLGPPWDHYDPAGGRIWAVKPGDPVPVITLGWPATADVTVGGVTVSFQTIPNYVVANELGGALVDLHPEDLDVVPQKRDGFASPEGDSISIDFGGRRMVRGPAEFYADHCGEILVTQEFPTESDQGLGLLSWNGTDFQALQLLPPGTLIDGSPVGHFEHSTFWGGQDCVPVVPEIDIRKQAEGADTRTFPSGSDVPFTIVVTNKGTVDLFNVAVTDALMPGCDRTFATLPVLASETYTCTQANVTAGFTNIACVTGKSARGIDATPQPECDPSTVVILTATHGCTPGFWKTHASTPPWGGYTPSQTVGTLFTFPVGPGKYTAASAAAFANETLLTALDGGGGKGINGKTEILLRAAVAALLNAHNGNPPYPLTEPQIISAVQAALNSGNQTTMTNLATELDNYNNACDLQ